MLGICLVSMLKIMRNYAPKDSYCQMEMGYPNCIYFVFSLNQSMMFLTNVMNKDHKRRGLEALACILLRQNPVQRDPDFKNNDIDKL